MKNIFFVLIAALMAGASCNKVDSVNRCARVNVVAPSSEITALQSYISVNGISAVADERGFFYVINRQSADTARPTICSRITVSYTGRLTNGQQFDASGGTTFLLSGLIIGWQEGIPLIGKGGAITLYLPPSLGYGSKDNGNIPGNSILKF